MSSPKDRDARDQFIWLIENAASQALTAVGHGRGGKKKNLYKSALANALEALINEHKEVDLRVVIDWPVTITVGGGELSDSSIPLVVAVPVGMDDQPITPASLASIPDDMSIDFVDLQKLVGPDVVRLLPLVVIDISTTAKDPFIASEKLNLKALSDALKAPIRGIVNFGKPDIRMYFPDTRQDSFVNHPTSTMEPHQNLPEGADQALSSQQRAESAQSPNEERPRPKLPDLITLDIEDEDQ